MSRYPRRIRVKINWSDEGIKRFLSATGQSKMKLPTYKLIVVNSIADERRKRAWYSDS